MERKQIFVIALWRFCMSSAFNICDVTTDVCLPFRDFSINCTCFLLHNDEEYEQFLAPLTTRMPRRRVKAKEEVVEEEEEPANRTLQGLYLRGPGFVIPMERFKFFTLPDQAKTVFNYYITHDYEGALQRPLPDVLFESYEVEENFGLFSYNLTALHTIRKALIQQVYYSGESKMNMNNGSCSDITRCHFFNSRQIAYDNKTRTYSYTVELANGFSLEKYGYKDIGVFVYSTALAKFQLNKLERNICREQCRHLKWITRSFCRKKCNHEYRHYNMAFTGRLKLHWQNYVRGMVIHNIRQRYIDYFPWKPS